MATDHDTSETPLKRCSKCKQEYPATTEYFNKHTQVGLHPRCKTCLTFDRGGVPFDLQMAEFKSCRKCGVIYPATAEYFSRSHRVKSGLYSQCKACVKVYDDAFKAANPDKMATYSRNGYLNYKERHPERYKAQKKKYKDNHKAEIRVSSQDYYKRNKERIDQTNAEWQRNHPEHRKAVHQRRKARQRNLPDTLTADEWQRALNHFGGCCAACGRPPGLWHVIALDHWEPLVSPTCPGTVAENIIPLCHSRKDGDMGCNNSKARTMPDVWLVERFGKRKARQIAKRVETYFKSIRDNNND